MQELQKKRTIQARAPYVVAWNSMQELQETRLVTGSSGSSAQICPPFLNRPLRPFELVLLA